MKIHIQRITKYSSYKNLISLMVITLLWFSFSAIAQAKVTNINVKESPNSVYLVQMQDEPVLKYKGGINDLKSTKPAKGTKIDKDSPEVVAYVSYLNSKHQRALSETGGQILYHYYYSFNGFAAKMTRAQAQKMAGVDGVIAVTPDSMRTINTTSTPSFLGLDASGGLWDQLGGPIGNINDSGAGENILIGVIDSGIWPENHSFSDRRNGELVYNNLPRFNNKCEGTAPDGSWNAGLCNNKLVIARHFNAAWGGDAGIKEQLPWEFLSPRDYNSHGSHTTSTAGGNNGVQPTGDASIFSPISGMAPRARLATYKALWSTKDASNATGFDSDIAAAIDQAVADRVDVINFSISGTTTDFTDSAQFGFMLAADAGIFVSASAGNAGPFAGTVAHPGPWVTTVAAGTHNRGGVGSITLGNGNTLKGGSFANETVGPAPIVLAVDSGLPGAHPDLLRFCVSKPKVLDPAKVSGKIVVCQRGGNIRIDKSLAVNKAGGVGMVLQNLSRFESVNADLHFVPTVHLNRNRAKAVVDYVNSPGQQTATINEATVVFNVPAPFTAIFSSRGPLQAGGGDLLKPDVMAPGVDILADVAPPGDFGRKFDLFSGTSMSAPHVAGVAALLKQLHPTWSPMMIKSALMTTGYNVLDPGSKTRRTFSQGAGHIDPNKAADPGLVYDSSLIDWLAFLCGTTNAPRPVECRALSKSGLSLDASNLNLASIAIGDLAGIQTISRIVTNVSNTTTTYTASVKGLEGVDVNIEPSSFSIGPGQTKKYKVTFTTTTAALDKYVSGQLIWSDGSHRVRSPLIVRPVLFSTPDEVFGTGGPIIYKVRFGYTGDFSALPRGLVPAREFPNTITDDPTNNFTPGGPGTQSQQIVVPAGTTYARFSTFDANVRPPSDLDMYVFNSVGQLVGLSTGPTAEEEVNLINPAPDTYTVWIHGFGVPPDGARYTLFTWVLGSSSVGNMTVRAPDSATLGTIGRVKLNFHDLAPSTKYLGSVFYSGNPELPNPTIVRVDTQ